MNLMDIHTKKWHQPLLDACGPNLAEKLGTPIPSTADVGPVAKYFVERYGFSPKCRVIACTGDNPASLIGKWICIIFAKLNIVTNNKYK